jgi:L-lactate permease
VTYSFTLTLSHMVATFAWYTPVQRRPLSAAIVFSALPAFELIRGAIFDAVWLIPFMVTARVSIVRLQEFLNDVGPFDSTDIIH